MKWIKQIYDWMGEKTKSTYADLWLSGLFFIEAFFFIPVDPLLILFCIENRKKSFYYATVATLSSVAGGLFGYFLGAVLWESIGSSLVKLVISQATFDAAVLQYKHYQNWAVLIAGFTPLPYKAITLSAGFCKLSILPFLVCSLISRGARFFLVSGAIFIWGARIKIFIDRYFNQLVILFTILIIGGCLIVGK
jgi:membrane protein YqaA with SNARE-associated domain